MRSIALFSLLCLLVACNMFGGCAVTKEVKFLAEEAYIPATKATIDSLSDSSAVLDVTVVSNQNVLIDLLKAETITFSGMTPGNKFMYKRKDGAIQERTVSENGTYSFKISRDMNGINVFYGYTPYVGRWVFLKNPVTHYQWDPKNKTFKPATR